MTPVALKKSAFRCLHVVRYAVAATVTVLMVAVIVYAVKVVHRPDDLTLWIVGGSISVEQSGDPRGLYVPGGSGELTFRFIIRAVNPSGRVKYYYTRYTALLRGRNSSSVMQAFLKSELLPGMAVRSQSTLVMNLQVISPVVVKRQEFYFQALANGSTGSISDPSLKLNGTRIIGYNFGHNGTEEQAVYYCSPITFGDDADADTAAADVPCTEDPPTSILDDGSRGFNN